MRSPFRTAPMAQLAVWCAWCVWFATLNIVFADGRTPSAPIVVQGLLPNGLRISVPEISGTDVVTVNANINFPISKKEAGTVSGSVLEPKNGYWSLERNEITVKPGDVVFYWVYSAMGDRGDWIGGNQVIYELVDKSCRPSPTTVNGRTTCAGQLILNEEFDTFNTSLWKHSIQFSDDPYLDFSTYTNDPANSFVKDGRLHLRATVLEEDDLVKHTKLEGCTWTRGGSEYCERKPMGWDILPPTHSAMITTKGTFSFKYGRIDIRAKAAAGDWLLSKIMLEPQAGAYGSNPYESGRVEIARVRGNADLVEVDGRQAGAVMNVRQADIATCYRILYIFKLCELKPGHLFSDEMHIYSVIWTPKSLTIRLDDDCDHEVKPPEGGFLKHGYFEKDCHNSAWEKGTYMAPFDKEFYVHFNLQGAGFNTYQQESLSGGNKKPWSDKDPRAFLNFWRHGETWHPTWKSDMEIDYVKVWSL